MFSVSVCVSDCLSVSTPHTTGTPHPLSPPHLPPPHNSATLQSGGMDNLVCYSRPGCLYCLCGERELTKWGMGIGGWVGGWGGYRLGWGGDGGWGLMGLGCGVMWRPYRMFLVGVGVYVMTSLDYPVTWPTHIWSIPNRESPTMEEPDPGAGGGGWVGGGGGVWFMRGRSYDLYTIQSLDIPDLHSLRRRYWLSHHTQGDVRDSDLARKEEPHLRGPIKMKWWNDRWKWWHFCSELESFQRASSLQGPCPLTIILEHTRGAVGIGQWLMKVYWLHTQRKDDGQHYFRTCCLIAYAILENLRRWEQNLNEVTC